MTSRDRQSTRLPDPGQGQVELKLAAPAGQRPSKDGEADIGLLFNSNTRHLVGVYGTNPTEDYIWFQLEVDGNEPIRIDLPPGSVVKQAVTLRNAPRTRIVTKPVTERRPVEETVEALPFNRIVMERIFARPLRNSPVVLSVTETIVPTGTSHQIAMPSTVDAGDLLANVMTWNGDGSNTSNGVPSGWEEDGQVDDAPFGYIADLVKEAVGNEDGTNVNFTTSSSAPVICHVYRYEAGTWDDSGSAADAVQLGGRATGNSSNPNPGSLSPSWGSDANSWIAIGQSTGDILFTAVPSGYTSGGAAQLDGSEGELALSTAYRTNEAASENPAAFTMQESFFWLAATMAVKPGEAGVTVDVDPPPGVAIGIASRSTVEATIDVPVLPPAGSSVAVASPSAVEATVVGDALPPPGIGIGVAAPAEVVSQEVVSVDISSSVSVGMAAGPAVTAQVTVDVASEPGVGVAAASSSAVSSEASVDIEPYPSISIGASPVPTVNATIEYQNNPAVGLAVGISGRAEVVSIVSVETEPAPGLAVGMGSRLTLSAGVESTGISGVAVGIASRPTVDVQAQVEIDAIPAVGVGIPSLTTVSPTSLTLIAPLPALGMGVGSPAVPVAQAQIQIEPLSTVGIGLGAPSGAEFLSVVALTPSSPMSIGLASPSEVRAALRGVVGVSIGIAGSPQIEVEAGILIAIAPATSLGLAAGSSEVILAIPFVRFKPIHKPSSWSDGDYDHAPSGWGKGESPHTPSKWGKGDY